jgi:3-isopropylmalate/(R)-2-methylmalate dehydratase large subunit
LSSFDEGRLGRATPRDGIEGSAEGEPDLLYIDLHLVHEVTSPQAFDGLRPMAGRTGAAGPDLTLATEDHNVPTADIGLPIADPVSRKQVDTLRANCAEFGVTIHPMGTPGQGIVHIIGPEQGLTLPGMTIVCGDSHTSTHGAFGALAFGIGTSRWSTCWPPRPSPRPRPKTLAVNVDGELPAASRPRTSSWPSSADRHRRRHRPHRRVPRLGHPRRLSMEGRMTVCNMSIEAGAKAGLIAPDETTFDYLQGRPHAPTGAAWDAALADWKHAATDEGATFDKEVASTPPTRPRTSPGAPTPAGRPDRTASSRPEDFDDPTKQARRRAGARVHGPHRRHADEGRPVDTVFIGSCTNGRIEDLRAVAEVACRAARWPTGLRTWSCPGLGG